MREPEIGGDRRVRLPSQPAARPQAENSPYFGKTVPPEGQHMRYISGSEPESLDPQVSSGQPEARLHSASTTGSPNTIRRRRSRFPRWPSDGNRTRTTRSSLFISATRNGRTAIRSRRTTSCIRCAAAWRRSSPRGPHISRTTSTARRPTTKAKGRPKTSASTAVDDRTVRYTLTQSVPFFPGLVAHQFFRPVPRKAVEAYGQAWTQPQHIVTSGAFILETWKPYDKLVYRPQSALLGRGERQARVDHVLPDRRRDDDDEPVQGGRNRRAVQPHSAGCMDRSPSPDQRSHGQAGVRDRLLHAEHDEGRRWTTCACARRSTCPSTRPGWRRISARSSRSRHFRPKGSSRAIRSRSAIRSILLRAKQLLAEAGYRDAAATSTRTGFRSPRSSSPTTPPSATARSPSTCRRSGSRTSA